MYYHGTEKYQSLDDPRLLAIAKQRVAEKCQNGGRFYNLVHYGTIVDPPKYAGRPCTELRQGFNSQNGKFVVDKTHEDYWQWLRQDGYDGWIWRLIDGRGPCPNGRCNSGFLSTPLIMPWEECTASPCPKQCIDTSTGHVECPALSGRRTHAPTFNHALLASP
jgi:hypothetical protein